MTPLDYFSNPDNGILAIVCGIAFALNIYQARQVQSKDKKIDDLQDKLLTRADAYATKLEGMTEKNSTTVSQLNELFKNGNKQS